MVGDTLRKERERQGLSIKDIEKGTSIRALYLEAIEKGDHQTLPGEVYAKGFVRNYANFLKIDADACVKQYQDEISLNPVASVEATPSDEVRKPAFSTGADYHERIEKPHQHQNTVLIALMLVIILVGGWLAFGDSMTGTESSHNAAGQTASSQTTGKPGQGQSPATAAQPSGGQANPAQAPVVPPGDEIDLHAKFTDRCWMQVVADGQIVYEGTAEAGESMSWKAKDKIEIVAGNAGAVDITQNGTPLGNPGDYGTVAEKVYTR